MIPKILHFVYMGGLPFSFVHWMAMQSAVVLNRPEKVYVHCSGEPSGPYWDRIRPVVTLVPTKPVTRVFDRRVSKIPHQADVVRLRALLEFGGIYLDIDTISVQPLTDLLSYPCVLGVEGEPDDPQIRRGLGNAVILAEPHAPLIERWYKNYANFDDTAWDFHSTTVPSELADRFPDEVHIEPYDRFYYPLYTSEGIQSMFASVSSFPSALVHHLWQLATWKKHLKQLDDARVKQVDSTYNLIARRFLDADPLQAMASAESAG